MTGRINQLAGAAIERDRAALAEAVAARHHELKPELDRESRNKCAEDAAYHLSFLSEALTASEPALFADYVAWAKSVLAGRGISESELTDNLKIIKETLVSHLSPEHEAAASFYVESGFRRLDNASESGSGLELEEELSGLAAEYLSALLKGDRREASRLILSALETGAAGVREIYLHVFQKTQYEIGRLWQLNRISVAQEHFATAATQLIMSQLYNHIFSEDRNDRTLVAACVSGDLHEIGVRIVSDFFEMDGWDTFYLGADTPADAIVGTVRERKADLLLLSATMTFHVKFVREVIGTLRADPDAARVPVMVGGYPFKIAPNLWREIGADGFAADAPGAVETANRLFADPKK